MFETSKPLGGSVIGEDQQNICQEYQSLLICGMAGGFFWDRFLLDLGSSSLPFDSRSTLEKNITRINWANIFVHWQFTPNFLSFVIGISAYHWCVMFPTHLI